MDIADGSVEAAYEYGPFGEPLRATGDYADDNPFRYSTKFMDVESGQYNYGFRYYNPTYGRFISRDPIGEAGGVNLYGFAGNDPVNNVDILGLCDDCGGSGIVGVGPRFLLIEGDPAGSGQIHGGFQGAIRAGNYIRMLQENTEDLTLALETLFEALGDDAIGADLIEALHAAEDAGITNGHEMLAYINSSQFVIEDGTASNVGDVGSGSSQQTNQAQPETSSGDFLGVASDAALAAQDGVVRFTDRLIENGRNLLFLPQNVGGALGALSVRQTRDEFIEEAKSDFTVEGFVEAGKFLLTPEGIADATTAGLGATTAATSSAARLSATGRTVANSGSVNARSISALAKLSRQSVDDKLARYLLNQSHPVGGHKAKWFEKALGFTKDNADDLAEQLVFDPKNAVQTAVTEHGIKFNQVVNVTGANGRVIPVQTAWIVRNGEDFARLVTATPFR